MKMSIDDELAAILGCPPFGEDREVDVVLQAWERNGFVASNEAIRFAARFDCLSFRYPRHPIQGGYYECELNAVRAAHLIDVEKLGSYEVRTRERMTPVGISGTSHLVLLVSESGQIYGAYDAFLANYGETAEQALINIYKRVKPKRISG
jgi:hypothetical protein